MPRWAEVSTPSSEQSGFTLFELIIVIVLVGLLFLIASWRLLPLRGDAEAAHVANTVGALRSALGLEVTERIVEDSLESAAELDRGNPMDLLAQVPAGYIGEVPSAGDADIPAGSWYYDQSTRQLRYRVRFPQYLAHQPQGDPVELSWQVRLRYLDNDGDERYNAQADSLRGIALEAMDNPQWPDPEDNIPEVLETP
ncbi:prepilin-type N-terminal cleavage/methylation domain-containing protein [Wenzhouxiangella sediminis]|uniref:prepilin-type N-terminal cleavage/methylation domain-containing protein n=1 Tax=Wenzhouxiangella sediminis TaxID=1792836 RepID=UPI0015F277A8|nr:prepilin-type N-terminal cleavage/methylation domain-containing protein [Wenzhouxiangella sediminis]